MNLKKAELKKAILNDLGNRFEDEKEAIEKQIEQLVGARTAMIKIAKDIQVLHGHADRDLDEGKISDLETLKLVKLYVSRAIDACQNQSKQYEVAELRTRGKHEQAVKQVQYLAKLVSDEDTKLRQILDAIDSDTVVFDGDDVVVSDVQDINVVPIRRPVGVRPGVSIAAQRKAEAAEPVEESTEAAEEAEPVSSPVDQEVSETSASSKDLMGKKKKRRRKAKGNGVNVAPDAG